MAKTSNEQQPTRSNQPKSSLVVGLSIVAAILLVVASAAFWFNKYIFDQSTFTQTATASLQQESSRQALAAEITDRLLANRPVLSRVLEEPATKVISGVLGSTLAEKAYAKAVDRLHATMTSPNPEDITIDLSSFKQLVAGIVSVLGSERPQEPAIKVEDLPDTITIVQASRVPNVYTLGVTMLWVGPVAAIIAAGLLAYLIYAARANLRRVRSVLSIEGLAIAAGGLLALLVGPIVKPMLLSGIQSSNMRNVADNLFGAFVLSFNRQMMTLLILAGALLLVALAMWAYRPVANWARSMTSKANTKSTPK